MTTQLVKVDFHDDPLWVGMVDGKPLVAVNPISVALSLDPKAQRNRIDRDEILSKGKVIMTLPSPGGPQETLCLPLDLIPGFIFGIDDRRIKDESIREKVLRYKRECYAVLYRHFFPAASPVDGSAAASIDPDTLSVAEKRLKLDQVMQCRLIFGQPAARELWAALGLEMVPAMVDLSGVEQAGGAAARAAANDLAQINRFIAERIDVCPGVLVPAHVLYSAYRSWCDGAAVMAVSNKLFSRAIQDHGFRRKKSSGMYYSGLRLKPQEAGGVHG